MSIRVIINGATGKMGQHAVVAIDNDPELISVAALSSKDNLAQTLQSVEADVVLDLTAPAVVYENCLSIIEAGVHPVIGTTGLTQSQIDDLTARCADRKLGGILAPNFSIGAILMMHCAQICAKYLPDAEIIEMHHPQKKDAPSGTALKTQALMQAVNDQTAPIHSVRLPGLLAHQQVLFGNDGESLSIQHDTNNRDCFMPGVLLACKHVLQLDALVYGLEKILLN